MKGYKNKMYKLLLAITVGGFVFAGSWDNTSKSIKKSDSVKNQFCPPYPECLTEGNIKTQNTSLCAE